MFFFDKFLSDLVPYKLNDKKIFFHYPKSEKGLGFIFPNIEVVNGKPVLQGVKIPKKINLEYERYKKLCKSFAKLNLEKYNFSIGFNKEKHSIFIYLNKKNGIGISFRLL